MFKKFAKGLLFGTAVGGIVATLSSTRTGKETRQSIKDQGTQTKNTFVKFASDVKNVKATSQQVKAELVNLEEVKNDTSDLIEDFKFQAEPRIKEINNQVNQIKERLSAFQDTIKK